MLLVTAPILGLLAAGKAASAPLGLELSLETGANELQNSEEWEWYLRPEAQYAFGDTGLRAGLAWEFPVLPEVDPGGIEAWQEYEITLPGVVLQLGNDNIAQLKPFALEGYLYAIGAHGLGDFLLELELDLNYAPAFGLSVIPAIAYEKDLGPGTLGLEVRQNLALVPQFELGDTELLLGYELGAGAFWVGFEIEPVLVPGEGLSLAARVLFGRHF
jgi:hypothetical protein